MAIEVKTKKWGNSLGLIIPSETADELNLKPQETIVIEITKKENVLKELFGKAKFKKSTKKMLEEYRKETESKWMK